MRRTLLLAFLLTSPGCNGSPARNDDPGTAVVELLHGRPEMTPFLITRPEDVREMKRWVQSCYKAPPPQDQIGSVFPAAALLFAAPAETFILYGDLDAHGSKILIPRADLDRLAALVLKAGVPYTGPARSGAYGTWETSPLDLGLKGHCDAPREKVKQASLKVLVELGYRTSRETEEDQSRCRILASRIRDGIEQQVRIFISSGDGEGCMLSVYVRTRSGAPDDAATWDLRERIEQRAGVP